MRRVLQALLCAVGWHEWVFLRAGQRRACCWCPRVDTQYTFGDKTVWMKEP